MHRFHNYAINALELYHIFVVDIERKYTISYRPNKNFDNLFETSFTCLDETILKKT